MFRSTVPLCEPTEILDGMREKNVFDERHSFYRVPWLRWSYGLILLLPLAGCDRDSYLKPFGYDRASLLKRYTPQDDESLAIHYVDLLSQDRFEEVEAGLDPTMKNGETRETLASMAELFPSRPISRKTVDANVVHGRDSSITSISLEYEFAPRGWLLAQVVIQTRDGVKVISGFHVVPISAPIEVMNEFTFADKGFSQYAGLCLSILVSIFSLYSLVLCIRTPIGKKKWAWLVLIAVGGFRLTLNRTTGQWFFTPLAVQVPPVMMFCSPYGPWMVQIAAPVGAIAFLLSRRRKPRIALAPVQATC
jgi:hypothetical protein